jgi:primosomal protein N' (replication factor Y)
MTILQAMCFRQYRDRNIEIKSADLMTSSSKSDQKSPPPSGQVRVAVMLATALPFDDGCLDYRFDARDAPVNGEPVIGQVVAVPLGNRTVLGVITAVVKGNVDDPRLKSISAYADLPPLSSALMQFVRWVAGWIMAPVGAVLKMVLPVKDALLPPRGVQGWVVADDYAENHADDHKAAGLSDKRQQVISALKDMPPMTTREAAIFVGVSPSLITAMGRDGVLQAVTITGETGNNHRPALGEETPQAMDLTPAQSEAARAVKSALSKGGFQPFVLDGVTGSGKTEVYFDAIAACLEQGQQALILLPEIALSPAMEKRFQSRFGDAPVLWHSGLTPAQRQRAFRRIAQGKAKVVIGARSALFLPYQHLGLITVDEEHDQSYKQDDHVAYQARDMAVMRAKTEHIPIILASATPSLETEVNIDQGRYQRLELTERVGSAALPVMTMIDLRRDPPPRQHWLAPGLVKEIETVLAEGKQSLLFLNRRGYAPLTLCRTCGERVTCPQCSAWLVAHKRDHALHCHHCGHRTRMPEACPNCETEASLVPCGPGVERLSDEVSRLFPDAKQAVLSSDLVATPKALAAFTDAVLSGQVDIIIGTQMITKGHHFPDLKLVGVVDADLGLAGGDLRAAENTWQMMVQVAGRAGRSGEEGKAILQTMAPETPVFKALMEGDRSAFLAAEKKARQEAGMPPYGRLATITLSSRDDTKLRESGQIMAQAKPNFHGVSILGPAPAPMAYLRGRHRLRFLIKAERGVDLQKIIADWRNAVNLGSSIRCQIDVDPYHFM